MNKTKEIHHMEDKWLTPGIKIFPALSKYLNMEYLSHSLYIQHPTLIS